MPYHGAIDGHQDKARAVSRVVIEVGDIRRSERFGGIGNTPGIPAPHIGIRNKMTSERGPIPYACDTSFRAVQSHKYQVDLIPSGLGFADQIHPAVAGEGRLDHKTHAPIEVVRRSLQNVPSGGNGRRLWIQGIQIAGYRIGIQQALAALEIDGSGEGRLSTAVRASDHSEGGHAALRQRRLQFANDFVVFSGRGALKPADLESSTIAAFHDVEAGGVNIEDWKACRKRLGEGSPACSPHRIVELGATEIVGDRHG